MDNHSVTSDYSNDNEDNQVDYFQELIDRLMKLYDDEDDSLTLGDIYTKLVSVCAQKYHDFQLMKDDPLWQAVEMKATDFEGEHYNVNVSSKAAFRYAMNKYKPFIMEKIKGLFDNDESESDSDVNMKNESDDETVTETSEGEADEELETDDTEVDETEIKADTTPQKPLPTSHIRRSKYRVKML
jgi:hypothetical protein